MAPPISRYSVQRLGDSPSPAYELNELLDRPRKDHKRKTSDTPIPSMSDELLKEDIPEYTTWPVDKKDWTRGGEMLPAKSLPRRTKAQHIRWIALVTLLATILVVGLSVLCYFISFFEPDTESFYVGSSLSCDLLTQNASVRNAFTLDLRGAAKLTYTEAKVVDVTWQLFVGAGGRFILGWTSYLVFMDGLTRLLEQTPVSYDIYASLTFQTNSVLTAFYALKAVVTAKGWRGKTFLTWFVISSIYVLGFPTLMSATGGYVTPSTSIFSMPNGNLLASNSDQLLSCYNMSAGLLIDLPENNTLVMGPPVSVFDVMEWELGNNYYDNSGNLLFGPNHLPAWTQDKAYSLFFALWNHTGEIFSSNSSSYTSLYR